MQSSAGSENEQEVLLPLTPDVAKLTGHLRDIMNTSVTVIQLQVFDVRFVESFKRLTEAVLASTLHCISGYSGLVVLTSNTKYCVRSR